MNAITSLEAAIKRVVELSGSESWHPVPKVRRLPDEFSAAVKGLEIRSSHYQSDIKEPERRAIDLVKKSLVASERRRGYEERSKALASLALELEQLRAALPGMAAKASIEIGILARSISAEAEL